MTARKQLDLPTDFIDLWFPVKKQKQKGSKKKKDEKSWNWKLTRQN